MRTQRFTPLAVSLILPLAALAGAQEVSLLAFDQGPVAGPWGLVATGEALTALPEELPAEFGIETQNGRRVFLVHTEADIPESIDAGQTVTVWYMTQDDQLLATKIRVDNPILP